MSPPQQFPQVHLSRCWEQVRSVLYLNIIQMHFSPGKSFSSPFCTYFSGDPDERVHIVVFALNLLPFSLNSSRN